MNGANRVKVLKKKDRFGVRWAVVKPDEDTVWFETRASALHYADYLKSTASTAAREKTEQ